MQIQRPPLAEGEIYLCGIVDANGDVEHTVLLPGENGRAPWKDQLEWAKSRGGDLPTRVELVILHEKHRDQFEKAAYWSNTPDDDPEYAGWAWYQLFHCGRQYRTLQNDKLRARAVRRFKN